MNAESRGITTGARRNGAGWASSTPVDAARATHAIDYTPTEPLLVVEVDADVCFEHERIRSSSCADKDEQAER